MFVEPSRVNLFLVENRPLTRPDSSVRRQQIAWINAILELTTWKRQNLATRAGISPATFSKFFNDPAGAAELDSATVRKVAAVSPLPPYETLPVPTPRGVTEGEAVVFSEEASGLRLGDGAGIAAAVLALKAGRNGVDAWINRSRALEAAGVLVGDVMVVDLNQTAEDGDVVCAQVYDRGGRAETVFRLYEAPFLVAATLDRSHFRPLYIDNDYVLVRGVVIATLRPRFRLAA